jgi:hypothetical protein
MTDTASRAPDNPGTRIESRVLLASVIAGAVLYGTAVVTIGTPPGAADSGAEVVTWFRQHAAAVRWSAWAVTAAMPAFAVVFAILRGLLPAPHRDVFLIGAISFIATTSVQLWTWAGLALHADRVEPATARTVVDVALFWGPVLTSATVTFMAPVTLLALRGRAGLPRWLGILGAIACVEQAVETITIFGTSGFIEPGGPMNLQLGAGLVSVWLIAFGVWAGLRGPRLHGDLPSR